MSSVVYFLSPTDGGPIRIGMSAAGASFRKSNLGSLSPLELSVLAVIPGGRVREAMLLQRFAPQRIRGDWFRPSAQLWALIGEAQETGDIAGLPPEPEERVPANRVFDGLAAIGIGRTRVATLLGVAPASLGQYLNASYTPASVAALHLSLASGWLTEDHYLVGGAA